jgi:hypothetical protein
MRPLVKQPEYDYAMRLRKSRKLSIPSWWMKLAPRQTAAFWRRVDFLRKESGVPTWDTAAITLIINQTRSSHERHGRHH